MNQLANPLPQSVSSQAEKFIDTLFDQLCASCTQLLNLSSSRLQAIKRQWILGFAENGITKIEQVKRGMAAMRAKPDGYLPSVGEFIAACREDYCALGLPTEDELEQRLNQFMGYARFDSHAFKYRSKAEYFLLKTLYDKYGKKSRDDMLKAMPRVLADVAQKAREGFDFPPIPVMLENKPKTYNRDLALKKWAELKVVLRGC